ncbi:MAG: EamA family transporter, partial [Pyrinomonadaceae bacterium]
MNSREKFLAYGAWAAVCFFWGTTYLGIRIGLETLPPMLFAGMRFLIAGIILFSFLYFWRKVALPKGREWRDLGLLGLMLPGIGTGMIFLAEQWIP